MQTFGLIGGIASGKSTVAALFVQLGAKTISADQLGHLALLVPEVKNKIRKRWGDAVLDGDGNPDRRKIAAVVFEPSDKGRQELLFLQELTHPIIRSDVAAQFQEWRNQNVPLALLDAPLLLEAGWCHWVDKIVFVDVSQQIRLSRALKRGWSEQEFVVREGHQLSIEEKRTRADFIVDNSGTQKETIEQIKKMMSGTNVLIF